jgi:hypothetical protein
MAVIPPKPLSHYPWPLRWFFRRQARKYGATLAPSWLWGRLPAHFTGMLVMPGLFQRRSFPIDTARRAGPVQFEALRVHFTDDDIVALTAWIAFQNLGAKFNSALGAEEQGLCSLPDNSSSVRSPQGP